VKPFSERYGLEPPRKGVQIDSVDDRLRNGLWNCICEVFGKQASDGRKRYYDLVDIAEPLWVLHLNKPMDELPAYTQGVYNTFRKHFFTCDWHEVYDFIEFLVYTVPDNNRRLAEDFMWLCNATLQREMSAYRFVEGKIAPITDEVEIREIEKASDRTAGLPLVREHLRTALLHLSARENPDFRNSVKESISAVEALCCIIAQDQQATLGTALSLVEKRLPLHAALKSAFSALYGYASDAGGIRHALKDLSTPQIEDARFMLLACSAFVNYLVQKAERAGLELSS